MDAAPLATLLRERGLKAKDLARLAGVDKAAVSRWSRGKIPAERVLGIERVTGISRHVLRPDIYPIESSACQFNGAAE